MLGVCNNILHYVCILPCICLCILYMVCKGCVCISLQQDIHLFIKIKNETKRQALGIFKETDMSLLFSWKHKGVSVLCVLVFITPMKEWWQWTKRPTPAVEAHRFALPG